MSTKMTLNLKPSYMGDNPRLEQYKEPLLIMEKAATGERDLLEVCEVLDALATAQKQRRRVLKCVAICSGIFALLCIAAIAGLTYVVVHVNKDTMLGSGGSAVRANDSDTATAVTDGSYKKFPADLTNVDAPSEYRRHLLSKNATNVSDTVPNKQIKEDASPPPCNKEGHEACNRTCEAIYKACISQETFAQDICAEGRDLCIRAPERGCDDTYNCPVQINSGESSAQRPVIQEIGLLVLSSCLVVIIMLT